jgi:hypothetical protein
MKLVDRISQQNNQQVPFQRSLVGATPKKAKDTQPEGFA